MPKLEELSRREFAKNIAKAYLGVNAVVWGSDLIAKTKRVDINLNIKEARFSLM